MVATVREQHAQRDAVGRGVRVKQDVGWRALIVRAIDPGRGQPDRPTIVVHAWYESQPAEHIVAISIFIKGAYAEVVVEREVGPSINVDIVKLRSGGVQLLSEHQVVRSAAPDHESLL